MRILLVGDYGNDPRLGSAKVYHKLGEELRELGHECTTLLAEELGAAPAAPRLRWAVGPALAARAIRRAIRRTGPFDVIDAASAEGLWVAAARRAGRLPLTAVVARSHGLEHLNYQRMLDDHRHGLLHKPRSRRLWYPAVRLTQVAAAARMADRLVVLNPGDAAFAADRGWQPVSRIDVVPHGVSGPLLDSAPAPAAPRRGVLFCGTWTEVKGIACLVQAMVRLHENGGAPPLTVLGPGIPAEAVLADFPAALRDRVTVLPRAPEHEVMAHYRSHAVLVATSTYEGFGMVVLEAMSQRLPVVAAAVGYAPVLLADGAGGVLVPPRDPVATAAALRRVLADDALRRQMGDAGYRRVRSMTWRATAERTVEAYRAAHRGRR